MVAQRKATPTTEKRRIAAQRRPISSDCDDPAVGELRRLYMMRADALAWVFSLERRIGNLEHVMFNPEDVGE